MAGGRERLLDAAVELVAENGASSVTIRAVAERAKVSPGTVSYHFRSTDELIVAGLEHGTLQIVETLERLALDLQTSDWDAEAWARAFAAALAHDLEHNRAQHVACFEFHLMASRRPELRPAADRLRTGYLRIARIALSSIGVQNVEMASIRLLAMLVGLMLGELVDSLPGTEERIAFVLLDSLAEHRAAAAATAVA